MENEKTYIEELEFTLNKKQYKYEYGSFMYKNDFGHWCKFFDLEIHTEDKEFLESCCRFCMQAFFSGVWHGKAERSREIREILGINK